MTTTQLTPAQHAILAYALEHTDGKIDWFPDNIKGGDARRCSTACSTAPLITSDGTHWFVAAEGYDAMGAPALASASCPRRQTRDRATVAAAEATWPRGQRAEAKPAPERTASRPP